MFYIIFWAKPPCCLICPCVAIICDQLLFYHFGGQPCHKRWVTVVLFGSDVDPLMWHVNYRSCFRKTSIDTNQTQFLSLVHSYLRRIKTVIIIKVNHIKFSSADPLPWSSATISHFTTATHKKNVIFKGGAVDSFEFFKRHLCEHNQSVHVKGPVCRI